MNIQSHKKEPLEVNITPQINSDGMIVLDVNIKIDDFVSAADPTNVVINKREIDTKTVVADKEVLALGGLIENRIENNMSKTPLLGNIPLINFLFKKAYIFPKLVPPPRFFLQYFKSRYTACDDSRRKPRGKNERSCLIDQKLS